MYDLSMREPGPRGLHYESIHFNVFYEEGGVDNRVGAREIKGRAPSMIQRIWIVEQKREATVEEIKQLCKGTWGRIEKHSGG
jgi:hypothetical protein